MPELARSEDEEQNLLWKAEPESIIKYIQPNKEVCRKFNAAHQEAKVLKKEREGERKTSPGLPSLFTAGVTSE